MRSWILLILSLMTGSEAQPRWKCKDGWVNFTCSPKTNGKYQITELVNSKTIKEHSTKILHMKHLKREDFGTCKAGFEVLTDDPCPRPFVQTAYKSAETTIICDPGDKYKYTAGFFCKDNNSICENILSEKSFYFTVRRTTSGFLVSINKVSTQDGGVYWCGVKINDGIHNRVVLVRQIQLQVKDFPDFRRSVAVGQNFTYWCDYKGVDDFYTTKFICKGEEKSTCQRVISTKKSDVEGKFFMADSTAQRNISVTVREVTTGDSGTYWCAAESDGKQRKTFIHKLVLTVVPKSTSPDSSHQTTTTSAESNVSPSTSPPPPSLPPAPTTISAKSHSGSEVTAIICVAVLLLLLFVVLILIYKRVSCSKNKGNAAAQQANEYCTYEDIKEDLRKPQSQNGINTIYVTVNHPTNDSAGLHYSTIQFKSRDAGNGRIPKQSNSACQYSAVKYSKRPTPSPVNQPHKSEAEPLYSTVNKPQQQ